MEQEDPGEVIQPFAAYDDTKDKRLRCLELSLANKPHQDAYGAVADAESFWKYVNEGG